MKSITAQSKIFKRHQWDETINETLGRSGPLTAMQCVAGTTNPKIKNAIENHLILHDYFSIMNKESPEIKYEEVEPSRMATRDLIVQGYMFETMMFIPEIDEFALEAIKEADFIIFESAFIPERIERITGFENIFEETHRYEYTDGDAIVMTVGYYVGEGECPYDFKKRYLPTHNYEKEKLKYGSEIEDALKNADNKSDDYEAEEIELDEEIRKSERDTDYIERVIRESELSKRDNDTVIINPCELSKMMVFEKTIEKVFSNCKLCYDSSTKTDLTKIFQVDYGIIVQPQIDNLYNVIKKLKQVDFDSSKDYMLVSGLIEDAGIRLN